MSNVTTTRNGFRIDDITLRNARKQSAIDDELGREDIDEDNVEAPVSVTPEQVKSFYKQKIEVAKNSNEKRVYSQTIVWIDELLDLKKKVNKLESDLVARKEVEEVDNGIEE